MQDSHIPFFIAERADPERWSPAMNGVAEDVIAAIKAAPTEEIARKNIKSFRQWIKDNPHIQY